MKSLRIALLAVACACITGTAAAQSAGDWMIRVRALSLTPANTSDAIPSLSVKADAIHVSSKIFPEVDIARFWTKQFATELVLTYPQEHDVTLNGAKIGTFKHLPPTLMAQWWFMPDKDFRPYAGLGANFTLISDVNLNVAGVGKLDLSDSSVGGAAQFGFDYKLADKQFLNVDFKYVMIGADVKTAAGAKVSKVGVNPFLISVGYGWKF